MLHLRCGEESPFGVTGCVVSAETGLDKVVVGLLDVGDGEELDEWIGLVACAFYPVAKVE